MRLPTFYEQNLIPNWGKLLYFCVRIGKLFTEKSNCFKGVDMKRCIVKVPKGSADLYKKALEWKEFEYIVET